MDLRTVDVNTPFDTINNYAYLSLKIKILECDFRNFREADLYFM